MSPRLLVAETGANSCALALAAPFDSLSLRGGFASLAVPLVRGLIAASAAHVLDRPLARNAPAPARGAVSAEPRDGLHDNLADKKSSCSAVISPGPNRSTQWTVCPKQRNRYRAQSACTRSASPICRRRIRSRTPVALALSLQAADDRRAVGVLIAYDRRRIGIVVVDDSMSYCLPSLLDDRCPIAVIAVR